MKLFNFIHRRIVITIGLIILQVLFWLSIWSGLLKNFDVFVIAARILSFFVILYIINKNDEAGYKIIWLSLILLTPLFGGIVYLLFGNKQPSKKLRFKYDRQLQFAKEYTTYPSIEGVDNEAIVSQLTYLEGVEFPVYQDTKVDYYPLGEDNFEALLKDLKNARHFIFMEYFIVSSGIMLDQIIEVLKQKVQEGVEVRFMYDDFGCLGTLPQNFDKKLQSYGIDCIAFNKLVPFLSLVMNHRDHRKITVIDGTVGYTGGINIADEYINKIERFGHWKDTGIRLQGSAVWNLTSMFLTTWYVEKEVDGEYLKYHPSNFPCTLASHPGRVVPYGDSPLDEWEVGQDVYLNMIHQANHYLYIFTPYLIINEALQTALILASKRGVDVRICTPGIPDKKLVYRVTRSYYENLIQAGVRVYEYTPGFLHAKNFVCDDRVATVGTINLDFRSLFLHFECGVYVYDHPVVFDVKQDFLDTISKSKEITLEQVHTGKFKGLIEAVLRIFAPLL